MRERVHETGTLRYGAARVDATAATVEAKLIRPAPVEVELGYRAHWLVQLRWIASSAIIYGTFVCVSVLGMRFEPLPIYLIGAAVAIYNSLFIIALKWSEIGSDASRLRGARILTNGQIVADLLVLSLLIHFAGGVENPLAFFFIFHVIVASILLSRLEAFLQATLACLLYAGLLVSELTGIVPHVHVLGSGTYDLSRDQQYVGAMLVAFASTLYLAAYVATSIVTRLRRRDLENLALTEQLERKAAELQTAYHDLTQLEEIKSRYMRKVSHEIKPPLTSLHGMLTSLLQGLAGDLTAAQREMLADAETSTAEMLSLVSDLLVLSRAREARKFVERRPVDLTKVAARVVAGLSAVAASREVQLSVDSRVGGAVVSGDGEAMEQMVLQLASNAVTYTLGGGTVTLRTESHGDVVRLEVSDTGIGIPSADLPKVFNDFFRAENARRYREEGTGLGLSIAQSIVDTHGGQIDIESTLGHGTTVTVLLPAARENHATDESLDARAAS